MSPVGLGGWAFGGADWYRGYGPQDRSESIATIRRAVELGTNWLDTASVYGFGESERLIADAISVLYHVDRPRVYTKGGLRWNAQLRDETAARVGTREALRADVEHSLRRLRTDALDLFQMHWPAEDGTGVEDYWATLIELRTEGKVLGIGLSNHSVEAIAQAHAMGPLDVVQTELSAIRHAALKDILPWCAVNEVPALTYSPLASGLLSGRFDHGRVSALPDNDWRKSHPDFTETLSENLAVATRVSAVARRRGSAPAAVAVSWALNVAGVAGVIVGARTPDQIQTLMGAADLELDEREVAYILRAP